jgi:glutamate dehydrogenase
VLQLDERPRVRVLPRRDRFDRFVSILVYVPRERYGSGVRKAIGDYLADAYRGRVSAFHPFFPEGQLVRVHFIIALSPGEAANPDRATLHRAVEAIVRTLVDELARNWRKLRCASGRALLSARDAFSQGTRELFLTAGDIRVIEGPRRAAARRRLSPTRLRCKNCIGLKVL